MDISPEELQKRLALYSGAINLWTHQDNFVWSRLDHTIAIQAISFTVLTATLDQRSWIPAFIMLIAATSTSLMLYLISRDREDRDRNTKVKDDQESVIFPKESWPRPKGTEYLLNLPSGEGKGLNILRRSLFFILYVNLFLFGYFICRLFS